MAIIWKVLIWINRRNNNYGHLDHGLDDIFLKLIEHDIEFKYHRQSILDNSAYPAIIKTISVNCRIVFISIKM